MKLCRDDLRPAEVVLMATWQSKLVDPPLDVRARELWLQHAAGMIIFEDVRRYAMERIDPTVSGEARVAIEKGIDDAVYGDDDD